MYDHVGRTQFEERKDEGNDDVEVTIEAGQFSDKCLSRNKIQESFLEAHKHD